MNGHESLYHVNEELPDFMHIMCHFFGCELYEQDVGPNEGGGALNLFY